MIETFLNGRVIVKVGDITEENTDAIVNAVNSTLLGGGGVDGAIHDIGGSKILEECWAIRQTRFPDGLPTGEAVITSGGDLRARHVIHTVGPIYGENDNDAELLTAAYSNSLSLAAAHSLGSIAFPSISTGAYGYPRHEAAAVASSAIKEHLDTDQSIHEIRMVFFSRQDADVFLSHHRFSH